MYADKIFWICMKGLKVCKCKNFNICSVLSSSVTKKLKDVKENVDDIQVDGKSCKDVAVFIDLESLVTSTHDDLDIKQQVEAE